MPIGAGHEDGEQLLFSDAGERFGGSVHCFVVDWRGIRIEFR